jgi:hypothetical protein
MWERAWHALTKPVLDPYRPEQHYMRGPGPKYRARGIERGAKMSGAAVTTSVNDKSASE